jgi:hypothetical protein
MNLQFLCYADDVIIYTHGQNLDKLRLELETCFSNVCNWFNDNEMTVNFDKTKFMLFHHESDKIDINIPNININGIEIESVTKMKYLGLILDPHLNFNLHYDYVLKRVCQRVKFLYGIKRYLSQQAMCAMVNAHLHSVIDYCLDIWCVQNKTRLDSLQKKIDRFLISYNFPKLAKKKCNRKKSYQSIRNSIDIVKIRTECNFLTVRERCDYVLLKIAYKYYIKGKLTPAVRNLCHTFPKLKVIDRRTNILKKSTKFRMIELWNDLPRNWDIDKMNYAIFSNNVKQLIVKKRSCDFV